MNTLDAIQTETTIRKQAELIGLTVEAIAEMMNVGVDKIENLTHLWLVSADGESCLSYWENSDISCEPVSLLDGILRIPEMRSILDKVGVADPEWTEKELDQLFALVEGMSNPTRGGKGGLFTYPGGDEDSEDCNDLEENWRHAGCVILEGQSRIVRLEDPTSGAKKGNAPHRTLWHAEKSKNHNEIYTSFSSDEGGPVTNNPALSP